MPVFLRGQIYHHICLCLYKWKLRVNVIIIHIFIIVNKLFELYLRYAARFDCNVVYNLKVKLLDEKSKVLRKWSFSDHKPAGKNWFKVYIHFLHIYSPSGEPFQNTWLTFNIFLKEKKSRRMISIKLYINSHTVIQMFK